MVNYQKKPKKKKKKWHLGLESEEMDKRKIWAVLILVNLLELGRKKDP